MGQLQFSKSEWQFPRSESLKWHLTSDICSENNNGVRYYVRKKTLLCLKRLVQSRQKEYIYLVNVKLNIMVLMMMAIVIQTKLMKTVKTHINLEKGAFLILGIFLLSSSKMPTMHFR